MQPGYAPVAPPPPPPARRSPGGTAVVVVLAVVILLCLGVGTAGYLLVVRVAPGASTPAGAADHLLTAIFKEQSADAAAPYICAEERDSAQDLLSSAAQYQQLGQVSWTEPKQASRSGDSAKVKSTLTAGSEKLHWTFDTQDQNGWRVCGISRG